MDIKIGDILHTPDKNYKVLKTGCSYGYDLLDLKNNKVFYDVVVVEKRCKTKSYYNIGTKYIGCSYRVGDRKQFKNGEYGILSKKNMDRSIEIKFDNGRVLKFTTIYAFHNGWATSEREDNKEYEISIGDEYILNKVIKGVVTDFKIGSPDITLGIGGKYVKVSCITNFPPCKLRINNIKHVLIGEQRTFQDGLVGTIEDVEDLRNILVSFNNNTEKIMRYSRFKNNKSVKTEPVLTKDTIKEEIDGITRVYQKHLGMYAVIKEKVDKEYFKVELEDGTIVNAGRHSFRKGVLTLKKKPTHVKVGERVEQNNGRFAEVIAVHSGRKIDVKFDDGEIRKNVSSSGFRQGSITNGRTDTWKCKLIEKNKDRKTVCGLTFSVNSVDKDYIEILWNNSYKERRRRTDSASITSPKGFKYIKRYDKLLFKNIIIDSYILEESDIYIKGICSICGKYIEGYVSELSLGHNCLENVMDYFGLKINVEHKGVSNYKITYLDGYSYEIENFKISNKDNRITILYKGLKSVRGNGVYLSGGIRTKVLAMYFDESIKRYRAVVQSGRGTQVKRRLVVLE